MYAPFLLPSWGGRAFSELAMQSYTTCGRTRVVWQNEIWFLHVSMSEASFARLVIFGQAIDHIQTG
jgi:hypothetical protein